MNNCWFCLSLRKSLIIVFNSALVQGLHSTVFCISGSWQGCITRGNWHLSILGVVGAGEEGGGVNVGYGGKTVGRIRGKRQGWVLGSIFAYLWMSLSWKQVQKIKKMEVIDQFLTILG